MHGFGIAGDIFFTSVIILTSPVTYITLGVFILGVYLYKRNKNKGN